MGKHIYRFLLTAFAAAITNILCNWHVLSLQNKNPYTACALDALFPWVSLIGFLWLVDDRDAKNRLILTAGSSVGLVIGTIIVFSFM